MLETECLQEPRNFAGGCLGDLRSDLGFPPREFSSKLGNAVASVLGPTVPFVGCCVVTADLMFRHCV